MIRDLVIDDRLTIPAKDLSWRAVRASGPGGQNVNKLATKVTLRFDLVGTESLTNSQKARLRRLAGRRIDSEGALSISAQVDRSQHQNLERARSGLRRLILRALQPVKPRVTTRPSRASKRKRVRDKRYQGEKKRGRARVRVEE